MRCLENVSEKELYRIAGYSNKRRIPFDIRKSHANLQSCLENELSTSYSCIFDWMHMRYIYVGTSIKGILGYDKKAFLDEGLNFVLSIIHPDDIRKLRELYNCIFSYYYSTPRKLRPQLRFSYNFRVKTSEGDYLHILRQSTFTGFTEDGKPILEFIESTDITGFNCPIHITLRIHKISANEIYELCYIHEFSEKLYELSERENQVFEFIKLGYTTKEIASKLYLSVETIKSHRKHILIKLGAANMTSAIYKTDLVHK
jgi:DNA-binding CsgD family transcriptional regulator